MDFPLIFPRKGVEKSSCVHKYLYIYTYSIIIFLYIYIYICVCFFFWGGGGGGGFYLFSVRKCKFGMGAGVHVSFQEGKGWLDWLHPTKWSELGAKEAQTLQPITAELVWWCFKKDRNCNHWQPFVLMMFKFIDQLLTLRQSYLVLEYVWHITFPTQNKQTHMAF